MEKKRLIIIDGSSLLSTSFYGTAGAYLMAKTEEDKVKAMEKLLKAPDGRYTNGVYTFMKTLLNIVKNQKPSHLAVVWDISRNTFRQNIAGVEGSYKGHRKETPDPLKEQFKTTQELLEGIVPQFKSGFDDEFIYEADDFAGSLVRRFESEIPCYCYTKDEDYLQLISEHGCRVWLVTSRSDEMFEELGMNAKDFDLPQGVFEYNLETFKYFKGLNHPLDFIDAKGLMGDKSDNIPGVKG